MNIYASLSMCRKLVSTHAGNILPTKAQESFLQNVTMGLILVRYFASHVMCRKLVSYKSAGNFPTKCFLGTNLNATVSILNMCRKFSYKMQENFLHTSVKCCTSAGKFPAHTVKIWIFLSSAGNMIPALQPPNTGALSLRLSFLISFACFKTDGISNGLKIASGPI